MEEDVPLFAVEEDVPLFSVADAFSVLFSVSDFPDLLLDPEEEFAEVDPEPDEELPVLVLLALLPVVLPDPLLPEPELLPDVLLLLAVLLLLLALLPLVLEPLLLVLEPLPLVVLWLDELLSDPHPASAEADNIPTIKRIVLFLKYLFIFSSSFR